MAWLMVKMDVVNPTHLSASRGMMNAEMAWTIMKMEVVNPTSQEREQTRSNSTTMEFSFETLE